jgi:hypothetical protein
MCTEHVVPEQGAANSNEARGTRSKQHSYGVFAAVEASRSPHVAWDAPGQPFVIAGDDPAG